MMYQVSRTTSDGFAPAALSMAMMLLSACATWPAKSSVSKVPFFGFQPTCPATATTRPVAATALA